MPAASIARAFPTPTIVPLGDCALLVRFGNALTDRANMAAIALVDRLEHAAIAGVLEVVPNLVSVLLRYDPLMVTPATLAGEVRLLMGGLGLNAGSPRVWTLEVSFDGPDLERVVDILHMTTEAFVVAHNRAPLRVLATGFAPGFVYCGLHPDELVLPRRTTLRPSVPAGSVLFAAGQTAVTATDMPTGWHHIGRTSFRNFEPSAHPPTLLSAGDLVQFEAVP